jgi:hypothetical protein
MIMYKQLKVDLTVSAEQLELLHFLLCNDRVIRDNPDSTILDAIDNPDSFNSPGSYAEQIEHDLWALVTHTRDNNLTSTFLFYFDFDRMGGLIMYYIQRRSINHNYLETMDEFESQANNAAREASSLLHQPRCSMEYQRSLNHHRDS